MTSENGRSNSPRSTAGSTDNRIPTVLRTASDALRAGLPVGDGVRYKVSRMMSLSDFCVTRGHEIISKGTLHDRSNEHEKTENQEATIPVPC